jgi:hypothetical protein
MRYLLLVFITTLSFSASAQWWRIDLKFRKREQPLVINSVTDNSIAKLHIATINQTEIKELVLDRSDSSFQAAEDIIMKTAQHNMRFRIYADASYNFSELARLYIQQCRFSEAKWFLLQSNNISRQQNDDRHTVENLIDLATVKVCTSDYAQAQQDLNEARDIASVNGLQECFPEINDVLQYIKQTKRPLVKPVVRYASAPQGNTKTE